MRGYAAFLGAGLCVLGVGAALPARAGDDLAAALAGSTISGYAKAMYVHDDKKGGRLDQSTPGFGGRLGAETGDYQGFRLKVAGYITDDLGLRNDNPRRTDSFMFNVDKKPYSILGEALLSFSAGRTALSLGRQEIHSPLINTYDYRIIPNLYEAWVVSNRDLPDTTLTLAYVARMSGLDALVSFSEFRSMSQQAYTSLMLTADGTVSAANGATADLSRLVGDKGVWMAGAVYEKEHKFQVWNYYGVDTLNTFYVDGRLKYPLSQDFSALFEAQAYRVAEVGRFKDYLAQQGLNASYALYGIKGTLAHRPSGLSLALAGNRFTGNQRTVTAFSNWGGYPEFVVMPYLFPEKDGISAIAGSRLAKLTALLDLGRYGLNEHSLLFGHARINIDEAILANSDIRVNNLSYRAKLSKDLSARLVIESRSSANARYANKYVVAALRYDF